MPLRERIGCDNDILSGGTEDDTLDGGRGTDYLDGGDGTNDITADRRRDNIVQGRGTQRVTDIEKTDRPCSPGRSARPRRPRPSALSPAVRDAAERARDEFVGPLPLPGAAPPLGPVAIRSHTSNSADLRITQASANPTTAEYGQDLAYTIKVKNAGPKTARDFAMVDETSKDVAHYETTVSKGDVSGVGTIVWELPVLHDGSTATMNTSGTVIADSATAVQNKPLVQAGTPSDTHTSDNKTTIITQLPKADLTLALQNPPSSVSPGDTIQIDYTVSNRGTHTATGVFVEDYLPPGVTFVPTPGCTYTAADRRVQCNVGQGQIVPGGAASGWPLTVTVDAATSGPVDTADERTSTIDESIGVTALDRNNPQAAGNHFYVVDAPGFTPSKLKLPDSPAVLRQNFLEFMRVRFDGKRPAATVKPPRRTDATDPNGGVEGSRASEYLPWMSRVRIVLFASGWKRDPMQQDELDPVEDDHNRIVVNKHEPLGNAP